MDHAQVSRRNASTGNIYMQETPTYKKANVFKKQNRMPKLALSYFIAFPF